MKVDDEGVCVINGDFPGLLFDLILLLVSSCFLLDESQCPGNVNIKSTGIKIEFEEGKSP